MLFMRKKVAIKFIKAHVINLFQRYSLTRSKKENILVKLFFLFIHLFIYLSFMEFRNHSNPTKDFLY